MHFVKIRNRVYSLEWSVLAQQSFQIQFCQGLFYYFCNSLFFSVYFQSFTIGNVMILIGSNKMVTVKILKIGTPEIITIIVLQLEQLDFTVQYCAQKMQTE